MLANNNNIMTTHDLSQAPSITKTFPIGYRDVTKEYSRYPVKVTSLTKDRQELPYWLNGEFLKQSGGAYSDASFLEGLTMIVGFHFNGSKDQVFFSNSILKQKQSKDYFESKGKIRNWQGTATEAKSDPFPGFWQKLLDFFLGSSDKNLYTSVNPNVSIWRLTDGDDLYPAAATEADGTVLRFDSNTLATVGPVSTLKPPPTMLQRDMIITTPAHYFEEGGIHIALEMEMKNYFPPTFIFKYGIYAGNSAPFKRVSSIDLIEFSYLDRNKEFPISKRAAYMHSYAMTKNYLILFLSRQRIDYGMLLSGKMPNGFFGLFKKENIPIQFLVLSRKDYKVIGQYIDDNNTMAHAWHVSNAYEDGNDRIIIDASFTDEIAFQNSPSWLGHVEISLFEHKKVTKFLNLSRDQKLDTEFPQINPKFLFEKNRFIYILNQAATIGGYLMKYDLQEMKFVHKQFHDKPGLLLSECVFAPSDDGEGEEDGLILITVTDTIQECSYLSILDPVDLKELYRIEAPIVINAGLHSHYFGKPFLKNKI